MARAGRAPQHCMYIGDFDRTKVFRADTDSFIRVSGVWNLSQRQTLL